MTALLKNKTWLNVRVQSFRIIDSISRRCPYCAESRSDHVYASLSRNGCDFPRVRVAHLLVGLSLRAEMLAPLRDGALWGENAQRQLPRDAARAREREVELRVTGTWAGTLWT